MTGGGTQSGSRQRTDDVELQAVEGVGSLIARPTGTRPEHGDRCAIRNALTPSQRHLTVAKGRAKTRALDVERARVPSLLHITEAAGRLQLLHKLNASGASQDARRLPQAADITPPQTLPLCSPRPKPQPRILPVQRTSLHPGPGSQLSHVRPAYWATIYLLQHRKSRLSDSSSRRSRRLRRRRHGWSALRTRARSPLQLPIRSSSSPKPNRSRTHCKRPAPPQRLLHPPGPPSWPTKSLTTIPLHSPPTPQPNHVRIFHRTRHSQHNLQPAARPLPLPPSRSPNQTNPRQQ